MPPRKSEKPARAYLLWGQEEIRKRETLERLIAELVPAEDRDLDVQYLDPANPGVTAETILHAARDRAMFSERRVVVVLNAGRLRGPRHQRTQESLASGLGTLPEYSTLIFVASAEESEERQGRAPFAEKLMAALKAHGQVLQFAQLKDEELARLAMEEAAAAGKKLAQPLAVQLARRAGPDSQRVLQEVRKLAAYIGEEKEIRPQHVTEMVPEPPDDNVFHMLEAIMDGERSKALGVFRQLREGGTAAPQLLTMVARTLRQVAQAKLLAGQRVAPQADRESVPPELLALLPEEGNLYRCTRDWQRKRLWGQAQRISWQALHAALDRLAVADAGTKGWDRGVEDPDVALELFILSVCDAVSTAGRAAPAVGGTGGARRWGGR